MEKIKQFFAAPTNWQRLALLSLLSMFISHIILLSAKSSEPKGQIDLFAVVVGVFILLFVVGWSTLNGTHSPKFVSRTIGTIFASFEIHRIIYSYIWPKRLDELREPTFQIFAIFLIFTLLFQSLVGETMSNIFIMLRDKVNKEFKLKFPKILLLINTTLTKIKKIDSR